MKMILLNRFIFFVSLLLFTNAIFNEEPMVSGQGLQNVNGTAICISPQQEMIAAGFADGTFKIFDFQVEQQCQNVSTASEQIVQIVWMPQFGPVTLDSSNTVTLWSDQCEVVLQFSLAKDIIGMSWFQSFDDKSGVTSGVVALNLQDQIVEHDIEDGSHLATYTPSNGELLIDFDYITDGQNDLLMATTTDSTIVIFNQTDKSEIDSFDIQSPIEIMTKKSQQQSPDTIIGLAEDKNIYRFTNEGEPYNMGSFGQGSALAFCPSTSEFVLSRTSDWLIDIYLYSGNREGSLTGLNGVPHDIDCSQNYLASIDSGGYINIYDHEKFKTWIIGMIVGIAVGLFLLVVGVIIFIKLKRKWAADADKEKYSPNRPRKYPRNNLTPSKTDSLQILHNNTLQTTMS